VQNNTTRQSVVFNDLFGKQVVARFDQPDSSSDGGAVLLKACDERLDLTRAIAACVADTRQAGKVVHSFEDLVRQRVFALALGYEDCNDAARIGADPVHRLLLERDPITGEALASQPTLSRFENALGPKALMRMGCALADTVLDAAIETVAQSKSRPVVHSDRGAHYRWPGWLSRIGDANLIRSMSRKGCSPDNAACEGFFGRLKAELFYPRDWKTTTIEQFIQVVDSYIRWYNEKRIKISLGSLSPIEYRESLGLTA
jgi:transposase InsO family protein